ncbi:hypothetical protein GCM10011577_34450 [Pseudarthrobacter polychromogenes]|uniref:Uncharacterized protein n=1 Tax=Pseudarthrobacter polychromogenes TaxID=1676 RepID=A0ABQ1XYS1_9MICC|nr:hypothetical protein GCM10011577_34450 [Pseudarthrobacter polychromogenes]
MNYHRHPHGRLLAGTLADGLGETVKDFRKGQMVRPGAGKEDAHGLQDTGPNGLCAEVGTPFPQAIDSLGGQDYRTTKWL